MTDQTWTRLLLIFEQNQETIVNMEPLQPVPAAKLCRESAHRTLGHLTACQSAWLPLMRQIGDGAAQGSIAINPDPLYRSLGYDIADWQTLVERFLADRAEWRQILKRIDPKRATQMPKRTYSAQTLTKRMAEHEKRHLQEIARWNR